MHYNQRQGKLKGKDQFGEYPEPLRRPLRSLYMKGSKKKNKMPPAKHQSKP